MLVRMGSDSGKICWEAGEIWHMGQLDENFDVNAKLLSLFVIFMVTS
jgi:hypothetical protein